MTPVLLLFLVEAASAPAEANAPKAISSRDCAAQATDEVVVCGSRKGESPYRLPKISGKYAAKPVRAEIEIAPGVRLSLGAGSSSLGAAQGVGLMATLKIKF